MKTRKIVLLAGIAALLCVYILQVIGAHRSPVKEFTLSAEPDAITIESASNGAIQLNKIGEKWLVNNQLAEENQMYMLTNAVKNVKTLGVISRSNAEADLQRYGLDDMTKITVTIAKEGKTLRTLIIGKSATNADQTYLRVDGGSETLIASGDLHGQFNVKAEDLVAPPEEEKPAEERAPAAEDVSTQA